MAVKDITHGLSGSRQYQIWCNMKTRCNRDTSDFYHNYGGRGINYDSAWESFEAFWGDMEECYSDGMSLERIDVNGNYCKSNCCWIPLKDQAKNRTKPSNNTSGITGLDIHFNRIGIEYARVRWVEDGKTKARYFSCKKYGKEQAILLANQYRQKKLEELGYGNNHGK